MKIRKFNINTILEYHNFINIHSNFFHRPFSSEPNLTPGPHTEFCYHLSLDSNGPSESILQPLPNLPDTGSLDECRPQAWYAQDCSRLLSLYSLAIVHAGPGTNNYQAFYLPLSLHCLNRLSLRGGPHKSFADL